MSWYKRDQILPFELTDIEIWKAAWLKNRLTTTTDILYSNSEARKCGKKIALHFALPVWPWHTDDNETLYSNCRQARRKMCTTSPRDWCYIKESNQTNSTWQVAKFIRLYFLGKVHTVHTLHHPSTIMREAEAQLRALYQQHPLNWEQHCVCVLIENDK